MDLIGVCPSVASGVGLTLLGNQPVPVQLADNIQCSRDVFDVILSYAQRLASFKNGGDSFASTEPLEQDFYRAAMETNTRLEDLGLFSDVLRNQGRREDVEVSR
jgi:hypothetical protein